MYNRLIPTALAAGFLCCGASVQTGDPRPSFRADVDVVMLSFTATDAKGRHIPGLRPSDLRVLEDGVEQRIETFHEQSPAATLTARERGEAPPPGVNAFVLFDTSNCMYEGFARAQDSISRFVRMLSPADSVAMYTFSRNMTRMTRLAADRETAVAGLRDAVAGDDTALYNSILLTVRDAATVPGRKSIIVFSNGPDNASMLSPDDVARVAQDEGIPIYVLSTKVNDETTAKALDYIAAETGGRTWTARWRSEQDAAFDQIEDELRSAYLLTYRPKPNSNDGFRRIEIQVKDRPGVVVRTRSGYTPRPHENSRVAMASE